MEKLEKKNGNINPEEAFMKEFLEDIREKAKNIEEAELFGEENKKGFDETEEDENSGKDDCEKAFFEFARAMGKKPEEIAELLKKGGEAEKTAAEFEKAKADSEIFEKLAEIRGISKEEMKNEILWALGKAQEEKMIFEIMEANPGMNREIAKELANFRLELKKKKPEEKKEHKSEKMLLELDEFLERHRGEKIDFLADSVIEEWEKGKPLEDAFEKFRLFGENKKLLEELEAFRKEKEAAIRRAYINEHSTGSAKTAAGMFVPDEFAAGLFREY